MRHKKTIELLRKHRDIFENNDKSFYILDESIPPLPDWFVAQKVKKQKVTCGKTKRCKPVKRIAIVLIAFALVVVFLAATPPGRSLAAGIYQAIINWYEDSIQMNIPRESSEDSDYETVQDISKQTFKTYEDLDAVYSGSYYYNASHPLSEAIYIIEPSGESIVFVYDDGECTFIVENTISADGAGVLAQMESDDLMIIDNYELIDGIILNGFYDPNLHEGRIIGSFRDHVITVISTNSSYSAFLKFIDSIEKK